MEIGYYEMAYDDIPAMAEMESKYFGQPWKEESISHYMDQGNTLFLAARDTGSRNGNDEGPFAGGARLVGYCALLCVMDEADLVSIAVDEDYRGYGIARELLDIAYGMLLDVGVDKIHLEVRKSNHAAIALYESEGFVQDGLRKGFYEKPREDALLYTRELKKS